MLFSVEQAFVGREEIRAPLKMPAGEAITLEASTISSWEIEVKAVCSVRFHFMAYNKGERN